MSIKDFLRNEGSNFHNWTFTRRQWAHYLLFLFFSQHFFQSISFLIFDVNHFFVRNDGRSSQRQTFDRRQWEEYFLFLFFSQHIFQRIWSSIWSLMFDVNQFFFTKPWKSKLCSFCELPAWWKSTQRPLLTKLQDFESSKTLRAWKSKLCSQKMSMSRFPPSGKSTKWAKFAFSSF